MPCEKRIADLKALHDDENLKLEIDVEDGWVETKNPEVMNKKDDQVVDIDDDEDGMQVIPDSSKKPDDNNDDDVVDLDDISDNDDNMFAQPA